MNTNKPKISIILPIYNVEPYLRQALDSVKNQTLADIEIICVDDCSTDNSLTILKEYAQNDKRFIIIEQKENKGQGFARNTALNIAKGEVIMFLDPDDWYKPEACEKAYHQIMKNNNDFVYMNYCFYVESGNKFEYQSGDYHLEGFLENLSNPNIKLWELNTNFWINVNTVCRAYKKEFLDKNNIKYDEDLRFCQDVSFFAKVLANAQSTSIISDVLYVIRTRANSASKTPKNYEGCIISRKRAYEIIKKSEHAEELLMPCLCYMLTVLKHFKRLTKLDNKIEKEFYNKMREFFIFLDKNENMEQIKNQSIFYENYKEIVKSPYYLYKFKRLFIYKDNNHITIKLFGIKLNIKIKK